MYFFGKNCNLYEFSNSCELYSSCKTKEQDGLGKGSRMLV